MDDIYSFYDDLTKNCKLSRKLRDKGLEPGYFQLLDKADFTGMGFTEGESTIIVKYKTKIKKEPSPSPGPGDNKYQQIRRFLQPANQVFFTLYCCKYIVLCYVFTWMS
jgi:hypothetical protein